MKKTVFILGFAAFLYLTFGVEALVRSSALGQYGLIAQAAAFAVLAVVAWFFVPRALPDSPVRLAALGLAGLLSMAGVVMAWAPMPMLLLKCGVIASVAALLLAVPCSEPDSRPLPFPGPVIRIFLGLTVLLELSSINIRETLVLHGMSRLIGWLPSGWEELVISASVAAAFMVGARIPARIPDRTPGQTFIALGVASYVLVILTMTFGVEPLYAQLAGYWQAALLGALSIVLPPVLALAHALLVIGVYRMLVNLRPEAAHFSARDVRTAAGVQIQRLRRLFAPARLRSGFELVLVLTVASLVVGFLLIRTLTAVLDQG